MDKENSEPKCSVKHACTQINSKRCIVCELDYPLGKLLPVETLKEKFQFTLELYQGKKEIIIQNSFCNFYFYIYLEAEGLFQAEVGQAFALVRDEIDIRTESLKIELDNMRDSLLAEVDEQENELLKF